MLLREQLEKVCSCPVQTFSQIVSTYRGQSGAAGMGVVGGARGHDSYVFGTISDSKLSFKVFLFPL